MNYTETEIDTLADWLRAKPDQRSSGGITLLDMVENSNSHGLCMAHSLYDAANRKNPLRPGCDECGEWRALRETVCDCGQSFGVSHRVCRECYEATPEPDTGRPDWSDL